MLNRIKGVVVNNRRTESVDEKPAAPKNEKYVYGRPYFLGLSKDEVENSRDFSMRPIFIQRNNDKAHEIPFNAGYAECINGGKSDYNEDNSFACMLRLRNMQTVPRSPSNIAFYNSPVYPSGNSYREKSPTTASVPLEAGYFGVFDGHAGYHVSLIASRLLHVHLQDKLEGCLEFILPRLKGPCGDLYNKEVSLDDLITGALEEAFAEMDAQLDRDRSNFLIKGGCTALVALFLNNKIYVANAGDCRAVLCQGETVTQVSRDFSPEFERQRLNYLGFCQPELLHNEFCCTEFPRRVNKNDLGKRMLCRKPGMDGWTIKTITEEDLRFPLITGEGRKARVMATIGVTRGLGDHDLFVYDTDVWIKPFLSCQPEVRIIDLAQGVWTEQDVLIMGSDGLWDGVSNEEAARIVREAIRPTPDDKNQAKRYTIAAQELVCEARGIFTGHGWRKKNDSPASFDDITAFVIPIKPSNDELKTSFKAARPAVGNKMAQTVGNHIYEAEKKSEVKNCRENDTDPGKTVEQSQQYPCESSLASCNAIPSQNSTQMANSDGMAEKQKQQADGKKQFTDVITNAMTVEEIDTEKKADNELDKVMKRSSSAESKQSKPPAVEEIDTEKEAENESDKVMKHSSSVECKQSMPPAVEEIDTEKEAENESDKVMKHSSSVECKQSKPPAVEEKDTKKEAENESDKVMKHSSSVESKQSKPPAVEEKDTKKEAENELEKVIKQSSSAESKQSKPPAVEEIALIEIRRSGDSSLKKSDEGNDTKQ